MSSSSRQPSTTTDLDLTILSAKHLKNVNWRNGILKPYCIFWVDPDRRLATKSDDYNSTKPIWNEQFTLPLTLPLQNSVLTLEIFHSKPSETSKPLIGTTCIQLRDLFDFEDLTQNRNFELRRPSGRIQGKIRLRLALRDRPVPNYQITPPLPNYQITPPQNYYYSSAPPPPPSSFRGYSTSAPPPPPPTFPSPPPPPHQYSGGGGYGEGYSSYYPRFERHSSYGGAGPSAPVDYTSYDQKRGGGGGARGGWGTGLGVGAVAGAMGGMTLDEGVKYEEDKISERDVATKEEYGSYRVNY